MTLKKAMQSRVVLLVKSRHAKATISFLLKRGEELSSFAQWAFPNRPLVLSLTGRFLVYAKRYSKAVEPLERASHLAPEMVAVWEALATSYQKLNRPWLQLEASRHALRHGSPTPHRFIRHARIARTMHRYEEAAASYERALLANPQRESWRLELADLLRVSSGSEAARQLYNEIEGASRNAQVRKFGIGHLLQEEGRWADAAAEFQRRAEGSIDANLFYRTAQAFDYTYDWVSAEKWYRHALTIMPDARWYSRLGFVLERQNKLTEAEISYKSSLQLSDVTGVSYRLGYVNAAQGKWHEAAFFLLKSFGVHVGYLASPEAQNDDNEAFLGKYDVISIEEAAEQAQKQRRWGRAAHLYELLIDRSSEHNTGLYVRRATSLFLSGQFKPAAQCLMAARIDAVHFGMDHSIFKRTASRKSLEDYSYMRASLPLRKDTIVYESFGGQSMACNPLAIFRALLSNPRYANWLHVWILDDLSVAPAAYKNLRNVVFIKKNSAGYLRYLTSASHLINNSTFPAWFTRRDGQRYLNTWHGTPLKTLGVKMKGRFLEHANGARNFLQATHLIAPNNHTARSTVEDFGIKGLIEHKLEVTGYPRSDLTVLPLEKDIESVRRTLGLKPDIPVLFYAPTWRGTHGNIQIDIDRLRSDLQAMKSKGYQIIYRGHSMEQKILSGLKLDVVIAPAEVDTSEILALTDVLVTDYSSVFFEFIPRKKPIVFYAFDFEEYTADRGFYLDIQEMPGVVAYSLNALLDALDNPEIDEAKHSGAMNDFCSMDDGKATSRVIEFFIERDVPTYSQGKDRRILFYAGPFMTNGITTSFVNLSKALTDVGQKCYVGVDPSALQKDPARLNAVSSLGSEIQLIGRTGLMPMTPEQRWIVNAALKLPVLPNDNISSILKEAYGLEYRRVFSDAYFDSVIHFEGYNYFWSILLANSGDKKKVAYFHNDMYQEWYTKNPTLEYLFRTYDDFDRLVSVSADLCEHNKESMSNFFKLAPEKFTYSKNIISPAEILYRSDENLDEDIAPWLVDGLTFTAVGRLSSEKDHLKLITAFAGLPKKYPGAKLLIIGDGPLRQMLANTIRKLRLESSVRLAGHRTNAFPAMKASMCFVLPSNHEGQPMVLLEAMTLGMKIIATDIPGNRGVLEDKYGHLVENSVEGLRNAMERCLTHDLPERMPFDANEYRRQAIADFMAVVT